MKTERVNSAAWLFHRKSAKLTSFPRAGALVRARCCGGCANVSAKGSGRSQVCETVRQVHDRAVRHRGDCVRSSAVLRKRPVKYPTFCVYSLPDQCAGTWRHPRCDTKGGRHSEGREGRRREVRCHRRGSTGSPHRHRVSTRSCTPTTARLRTSLKPGNEMNVDYVPWGVALSNPMRERHEVLRQDE